MKNQALHNTLILKALEKVDLEKAVQIVSDPNLDSTQLSEILSASLMGNIKDSETDEPLTLSNKVMAAGLLNRMEQLSEDNQ
jgi:hypothetical protein